MKSLSIKRREAELSGDKYGGILKPPLGLLVPSGNELFGIDKFEIGGVIHQVGNFI